MRILLLFVGLSALSVSVYYSFIWFYDSVGMPWWVAAILAGVYCIFASFVFEKAIEIYQTSEKEKDKISTLAKELPIVKAILKKSNKQKVSTVGLLLGWLILAGFSMFCTVGGQYNSFKEVEDLEEVEKIILVDQTLTIQRTENTLESLKAEEIALTERLSNNEGEDYMDSYLLEKAEARLDEVRMGINNKINRLDELNILQAEFDSQENFSFESENFFVYLRSVVFSKGTDIAVKIQFWSAIIPSVLIDIVSPICLTYFILGNDRKIKLFNKEGE